MKAIINALENHFLNHQDLQGVYIEALQPRDDLPDFERMPNYNILPRSKPRERVPTIGTGKRFYNTDTEIEVIVAVASAESLRAAFDECERRVEDVLRIIEHMEDVDLGCFRHTCALEDYEDGTWGDYSLYRGIIVVSCRGADEHDGTMPERRSALDPVSQSTRIEAVESLLKNDTRMGGIHIEAYRAEDDLPEPERTPHCNIRPRPKEREREPVVGERMRYYNAAPAVDIVVTACSMENLRAAFEQCESIADTVIEILETTQASIFDADSHYSQIQEFVGVNWEGANYYAAKIGLHLEAAEEYMIDRALYPADWIFPHDTLFPRDHT